MHPAPKRGASRVVDESEDLDAGTNRTFFMNLLAPYIHINSKDVNRSEQGLCVCWDTDMFPLTPPCWTEAQAHLLSSSLEPFKAPALGPVLSRK